MEYCNEQRKREILSKMLLDLNVPWPVNDYSKKPNQRQITNLKNTIATLYALDYTHIAINFELDESKRIPNNQQEINPIDIGSLREHFKKNFPKLCLFTRFTLVVSDPSQCSGLTKAQNSFDILAIRPTTEKALQTAVTNLDIDIISLDLASKLPFFLKHKTICSGVDKGLKFEICYSPVVGGPAGYTTQTSNENMSLSMTSILARKVFFNNTIMLVRSSRSRGLIVSSGASCALQARSASDALNLLKTVGLDSSRAKATVSDNPESALVSGRLRIKSYKQTIILDNESKSGDIMYNNEKDNSVLKMTPSMYKKRLSETQTGKLLNKKIKLTLDL